jgi:hypothetical protein
MRLGPEWVIFFGTGGIILALSAPPPLFAQATGVAANPQRTAVSVPFVGCASSGQIETLEAPKGTSKSVPISPADADALAYYESADGIGLLAPRNWFCEGASGSGGSALFLSPKPIHHSQSGWEGLEGTAIEINHISGENSGRYEIAEVMSRVFPEYRAIARRVWEDIDLPLPSGPYPKDALTYISKTVVEFNTPAQTEGLGNFHSWLKKSGSPIQGAAILIADPQNPILSSARLVLLSVRFPPDLARLTPTIIRYVERDVLGGTGR